ncbi:hypothetical protein E1B28_010432 [Marasmius oreades]|uniref:BTB domain-containing protein n=1 Tax=Marasmius oreades TaxID=181124 RepID=A0A9P7RX90_9AGAR|nr:uncharacterized protein E1B28_010432 [Marasmius oreades]KAG7091395.1 hypothetical protein E1B28_010432 [Marasmius oreades]
MTLGYDVAHDFIDHINARVFLYICSCSFAHLPLSRYPTTMLDTNGGLPTMDELSLFMNDSPLSISSTFGPKDSRSPINMILLSSDLIVFYVNESTLLKASTNSFNNMLPRETKGKFERLLFLSDTTSSELDLILRAIYNISSDVAPPANTDVRNVTGVIDKFPSFGIQPRKCITSKSRLFQYLLSCAPIYPLHIYALAAHHDMDDLAVAVSSHTLVRDLSEITDDLANRMGSRYLMRLFQLHLTRTQTLKNLLATQLGLHTPTARCGFDGQRLLKQKWILAVAALLYAVKPGGLNLGLSTLVL